MKMFDIVKYCQCQQNVEYQKLKTSGNDPLISKKMRMSQYINSSYAGRRVSYETMVAKYNIQPLDVTKANQNITQKANNQIFGQTHF